MATPGPLDAVANISITLFGDGSMQTQGNIADVNLALSMLEHAKDAVRGQFKLKPKILVPSYDVEVEAALPLQEYGTVSDAVIRERAAAQTRGGV